MNPETTGESPILDSGPTVQIGDRTITIRRLGIRDTFAIAKIIGIGAMATKQPLNLNNASLGDPSRVGDLLLAGFMSAEQTAVELLASIAGVTVKEFENPNHFPMGSEIEIIMALVEHQDLRAFLSQVGQLAKKLPEMQTRSQGQSTS